MAERAHYYKVLKAESVWGLRNVHAVMQCDGMVEKLPCKSRLIKVVTYAELEKKGSEKSPVYFYREPAAASDA